jgi:hypothetical protein
VCELVAAHALGCVCELVAAHALGCVCELVAAHAFRPFIAPKVKL